ncbi:hypothetical protein ASPSYDRAFT_164953 [Aspergillus sydowii CBS 593.65]|uniref:Nudix hydrolase domain-containing protein n=1 Tax=Aspergillus sydowii CBS 593.65 TaxID=1036612 RepID=A0A1L9SYM6_9EURO|nr:uncharacterized protein ASPSYDRAFT_164953 [Aspergillus sydowii CBS 593.65]OJJ52290.1 hypothetical protein ASPSYDRAFT_164953 [Aspergillus sydowii CBS 593.65]
MNSKADYSTFEVASRLKEEFHIPFNAFRAANAKYDHFVVGSLIFYRITTNRGKDGNEGEECLPAPCVLLLQRAMTDAFGGLWEIPGGSAESGDQTILEGGARETYEEAGLLVTKFVIDVGTEEWKNKQRGMVGKFAFIVEARPAEYNGLWTDEDGAVAPDLRKHLRLNPTEHQDSAWATEEEIMEGKYELHGDQAQATILAGFNILRENPGLVML